MRRAEPQSLRVQARLLPRRDLLREDLPDVLAGLAQLVSQLLGVP